MPAPRPRRPPRARQRPRLRDGRWRTGGSTCRDDREARAQAARRQGLLGLSRPVVRGRRARAQSDLRLADGCRRRSRARCAPSSAQTGSRSSTPAPRRSPTSRPSGGSCTRSRTSSGRRCRTTRACFNKHLLPRIGHMRLRDLSVPTLMRLRADLEADGVGRQAVRKSLAVLQSILQRAVEWERIGSNPARSVRKPPMRRDRAIAPLTPETVERIRTTLLDQGRVRDATLVSVLAYCRGAAAGGRGAALAARPQEHAADRAGRRRRRAQGAEDESASADRHAARALARGPCRLAHRAAA